MPSFKYYRHRIAATFALFSFLLSSAFGFAMFMIMQKVDDGIREDFLLQYQQQTLENFHRQGRLSAQNSGFTVESLRSDVNHIPAYLQHLSVGYHELTDKHLHLIKGVLPQDNTSGSIHYYLLHDNSDSHNINNNLDKIFILIAAAVSAISFIGIVTGLLLARQLSRPIQELQQQITSTDAENISALNPTRSDEFGEISLAYSEILGKIKQTVEREKRFSRYASHELRTPVAIIRSSLNLWHTCSQMEDQPKAAAIKNKAIQRISVASELMDDVIQTFLLLSSHSLQSPESELIDMRSILSSAVEKYLVVDDYQHIRVEQTFSLTTTPEETTNEDRSSNETAGMQFTLSANRCAVDRVLAALLRNSFAYCAGQISIELSDKQLTITNDIDPLRVDQSEHFGFGLEIVQQLCQQLEWNVLLKQTDTHIFIARINFPTTSILT